MCLGGVLDMCASACAPNIVDGQLSTVGHRPNRIYIEIDKFDYRIFNCNSSFVNTYNE